ncbi:hypothetical protein DV096_10095 [Bradymonadaceae bacterium TMQ3]|uniref:Lamin tail domain-containing protein n=1 Tax=Lujinxingia sediminis TaxID=2480984 RepID=A0ABY0CSJ8_9DELT|nr:hypothetical protein [Lujinxingia sediminis]RDV38155.1 hypothetical protein DV096_10095 [Bradymonadaceae bacterium TMQ3]RVU43645.1 hypothetical protein EA187_12530 [Lujinxingia sediminis]TXC75825.1 hypothetical protein FRC91_10000 [Bradymonadales bacterium TMQ1]
MRQPHLPALIAPAFRPLLWLVLCLSLTWATGCNLAIDLEAYPYTALQPDTDLPADAGADAPVEDTDSPDIPDADPLARPALAFSELMIRVEPPPGESQELGEYIEIVNLGDAPIDPRGVVIELLETNERIEIDRLLDSPKERAVVEALEPIAPGEHFLFYRRANDHYVIEENLDPTASYEYGRWSRPVGLSNFTRSMRLIELEGEFGFVIHDEVAWREGALVDPDGEIGTGRELRENVAFGLRPGQISGREPTAWCYHRELLSEGPLFGSPGQPTPASCR